MKASDDNLILVKSKNLAVRIIRLYKYLLSEKQEDIMSKQLLRSGTSIGANIREASQAQSKADFIAKMSIALKETVETEYWLELFYETDYLSESEFSSIREDCGEVARILISIIKTSKQN